MERKADSKNVIKKLGKAFIFSVSGLRFVMRERAFRMEIALYIALLMLLMYLRLSTEVTWRLIMVNTLVLIVEILNTAIETIVDMVSPGYSDMAKIAKDLGSAAVFLSILLASGTWLWFLI